MQQRKRLDAEHLMNFLSRCLLYAIVVSPTWCHGYETTDTELLPDGRRVVRGDHRLNNGWRLEDYDQLRGFVMSAIEQLETATRNAHTGEER